MKTREHPFSRVIHYGVGGYMPGEEAIKRGERAEFKTLCGRIFRQGHSEIMQSGAIGAHNTSCKSCRHKLTSF